MKVSLILAQKPNQQVATVTPDLSIDAALRELREHRIGALVVSHGNGSIDGILSERDIVRALANDGAAALQQSVGTVMTANVETCFVEETALEVLGRMTDGRFRHMPVTGQDGRMIGILSIGDVVKARLEEIERENAAMVEMLSH